MLRMLAAAVLAVAALTPSASAQKHCRKGIPCGGTCIAATKTCHVRTVSPPASNDAPPPRDTAKTAAPSTTKESVNPPWVASSRGHTFYRTGCSAANKLALSNLIYFKSEEEAKAAGYQRSRSRGC